MERLKEFLDWNLKNPHNVNFKMIVAKEDREETLKAMREMSDLLDTGLTPEQIIEMDKMYTELAKEVMQLRKGNTEKVPTENGGSDNHDRHGSY